MNQLRQSSDQPDPADHIIVRHAIAISAINPSLVIDYFLDDKLPEILLSLDDEVQVYTEAEVLKSFKANIALEDYEIKFYDFLCKTFNVDEISKLREIIEHPEQDKSLRMLVSTLLLGNKELIELVDEIFEQAIDDTKEYFSKG